jgi:ankyrin repeat protein
MRCFSLATFLLTTSVSCGKAAEPADIEAVVGSAVTEDADDPSMLDESTFSEGVDVPSNAAGDGEVPEEFRGTIFGSIVAGDTAAVLAFLDEGGDLATQDGSAHELLHVAAVHGRLEVVELLLERGASATEPNDRDVTPLHYAALRVHFMFPEADRGHRVHAACGAEHRAIAELLIERGADIHAPSQMWGTPLHAAARGGNYDVAELLVERGAEVNATDKWGATPLHEAACGGVWEPGMAISDWSVAGRFADVAELLLEHGARLDFEAKYRGTPLDVAASYGADEVARLIIHHSPEPSVAGSADPRATALIDAAFSGSEEILKMLLESGVDVNSQDEHGRTALLSAAGSSRPRTVEFLLERGADQRATNSGRTPLHAAAYGGSWRTMRPLIEYGGNLTAIDDDGETLLHAVAGSCGASKRMIDTLVESGLDVNATDAQSRTPLDVALEADCLMGHNGAVIGHLKRHGARSGKSR